MSLKDDLVLSRIGYCLLVVIEMANYFADGISHKYNTDLPIFVTLDTKVYFWAFILLKIAVIYFCTECIPRISSYSSKFSAQV